MNKGVLYLCSGFKKPENPRHFKIKWNERMRKTTRTALLMMALGVLVIAGPRVPDTWGADGQQNLQGNLFRVHRSLFLKMGILLFDDREKAPNFSVPDLSGKTVSLSDYRGRFVLLNFWATWCVPCRKEIPTLNGLSQKMAGKPFVLASIAMDHNIGHIQKFMEKVPIDFLVLTGRKGKVDDRYFGLGLPQTYLIDSEGYLIGKASGPRDWKSPDALNLINSLLPKRTAQSASSPFRETLR
jgi:thiol-disulfide isomerase/thioredoxin